MRRHVQQHVDTNRVASHREFHYLFVAPDRDSPSRTCPPYSPSRALPARASSPHAIIRNAGALTVSSRRISAVATSGAVPLKRGVTIERGVERIRQRGEKHHSCLKQDARREALADPPGAQDRDRCSDDTNGL
jgi:hypothetical protein